MPPAIYVYASVRLRLTDIMIEFESLSLGVYFFLGPVVAHVQFTYHHHYHHQLTHSCLAAPTPPPSPFPSFCENARACVRAS